MRRLWGWFFGVVSLVFLYVSISAIRLVDVHQFGTDFRRPLILSGCMIVFAFIFGIAWWTAIKDKSSARAWGIVAGLVVLFLPLLNMYYFHRPLTALRWKMIAFGVFALVAYAWPDREEAPLTAGHIDEADSNLQ